VSALGQPRLTNPIFADLGFERLEFEAEIAKEESTGTLNDSRDVSFV
jgi:hypothetical protein